MVERLRLAESQDFRPDAAKPLAGVFTLVAFARPDPLPAADEAVKRWFAGLPAIPRPAAGAKAVAWFDDYARPAADPTRGPQEVDAVDPYERWQAGLKARVRSQAAFQTAVSFAQAGGN